MESVKVAEYDDLKNAEKAFNLMCKTNFGVGNETGFDGKGSYKMKTRILVLMIIAISALVGGYIGLLFDKASITGI
jgi:hypothetical protein